MEKLTVHMIGNAHLDPVWQWRWPAGVDEALATCRSACDLLDEYPDIYFTRGEAWVHQQIQQLHPSLFARIVEHVRNGRWRIVNGWWIQPDCNLPGAASFRKNTEIGHAYFKKEFGVECTVGYNVDSFGHSAYLPVFLLEGGMNSYVFMRPDKNEKVLPGNLFKWSSPSGDSVTAFRISRAYCSTTLDHLKQNLDETIQDANREVGHVMCFYGVGDHGGGPTREQIEWILENRNYADDIELIFSHPRMFFDAVCETGIELPEVIGELQHHSVGCYTVIHKVKQELRKAESLAIQAGLMLETYPDNSDVKMQDDLDDAWQRILFNQFHDIAGGASIKSAYDDAFSELGYAKTVCRDIIVKLTRRATIELPPAELQRVMLTNASQYPFNGFVKYEPWMEPEDVSILDENGDVVPTQRITAEAAVEDRMALLIKTEIPPAETRVYSIEKKAPPEISSSLSADEAGISNKSLVAGLSDTGIGSIKLTEDSVPIIDNGGIRLIVLNDSSDTWSHGITEYREEFAGEFRSNTSWRIIENGPLIISMINNFEFNGSVLTWIITLCKDEPILHMRLHLNWVGTQKLIKLLVPPAFSPVSRYDDVPGGEIEREMDGKEYPIHNYIALSGKQNALAVISRDIFGADVQRNGMIRSTLLRTPYYAHHTPFEIPETHAYPVTDQGTHEYEISIMAMKSLDRQLIANEIQRHKYPVWISETTAGMRS